MGQPSPSAPAIDPGWSRWILPACVFLLLAGITVFLWQRQKEALLSEQQGEFAYETALVTTELRERLTLHAQFLRTLAAYFATRPRVSAEEWQRFSERIPLDSNLPGAHLFGFAPAVASGDREAFERMVRKGFRRPRFRISPPAAGERAFPVLHVAPQTPAASRAMGFDIYSETIRRQAIDLAGDVNDVVISGRAVLIIDQDTGAPGFLMLHPIYRPGMPISNVKERRAAFAGVVYAAYRMKELIQSLGWTMNDRIALQILDESPGNEQPRLHYDSRETLRLARGEQSDQHEMTFGHRTWILLFRQHIQPDGALTIDGPSQTLLAGLTISALLGLILFILTSQRQRAEAYARQVTANLQQAEASIRAADKLKQTVLDAATEIAITATDVHGVITVFNRGAEKMLGYRATDLIGLQTPEFFHLQSEVEARGKELTAELGVPVAGFDAFCVVPQHHGSEQREWTYVRADGRRLQVDLVVTVQRDDQGAVTGFLGAAVDITERKRAEKELKRQHSMLATIMEHMPGGVSLVDADLNFIACNQRLKDVLDFPDELFADGVASFAALYRYNAERGDYGPGDPEELTRAAVARALMPQPHRFERTRPNGKTIEVHGTPLPDGGFVTIYTDVTERKQAEAELERHRDHLQELVRERTAELEKALQETRAAHEAKSEFLANMSHELRTPMHAILSFSGLGLERSRVAGNEKLRQYFERIRQSAQRLLDLIDDLLDLSKLEAGRMQPVLSSCDVLPLLQRTVTQLESLLLTRQLQVRIELESSATVVRGDERQIERVVHNLLANAIKFSPAGGNISVRLRSSHLPEDMAPPGTTLAPALAIIFTDCGVGIPPDELELIFEKFVQSSKTKTGAGGTGLGLAICREIVRAHRGTIAAANNPGGGASFEVRLPAENIKETNAGRDGEIHDPAPASLSRP